MRRLTTLLVLAALACAAIPAFSDPQPKPGFELGVVSNANALELAGTIGRLGAPVARVEFTIDSTPRQLAPVIAAFARHGVRVLAMAGFYGRIPTAAEARNLALWAHAFGPGGTFWRTHSGGQYALTDIEFGNETNQGYQFGGCTYGCAAYVPRAQAYALALKEAQEAIDGPQGDAQVGLLAIGDDGGTGSADWVDGMFAAVPDLAARIAGWTAHSYGPRSHWQPLLDRLVSQMRPHGDAAALPVYITELGIATDGGPCLTDNFGWNPCMSYSEAAQALTVTLGAIRARYGERIRAIFLYQAVDQRLPRVDREREHYFGVLAANRRPKGAYTAAVKSLLAKPR
ncbi:MAG TPA: hypothetical protein VID29_05980 [Solirubrobacteraceae bacterium]